MNNVISYIEQSVTLDKKVFVIVDKTNFDFFQLEDAIQMFQDKKTAEKQLTDDDAVFLKEEHRKYYQDNAIIRQATLSTDREFDDSILIVALNEDNTIAQDEDSFLYVYDKFENYYIHDYEKFVVATLHFKK